MFDIKSLICTESILGVCISRNIFDPFVPFIPLTPFVPPTPLYSYIWNN